MTRLPSRARKILLYAVTEYIATGTPVGSRTLARKYVTDLSPATIRNVLSDLEEGGYLVQPHTSAGRVPTDRALRAFIEALTEFHQVPPAQHESMQHRLGEIFSGDNQDAHDALRRTGEFVSELTGAAAVIAMSPADTRRLQQLRFIITKPKQLLAVLVFNDGMVENRFIHVDDALTERDLEPIHNLLSDVVEGRTLGALRDLFRRRLDSDRVQVDELRRQAFDLGSRAISDLHRGGDDVVIEGQARLLELPEYGDVERLKRLVNALHDREHLLQLLDKVIDAGGVTVYIGSETGELRGAELSLVAAPYGNPEEGLGTVGVLGPTRMDYARLVPLIDATAAAITAARKKGS
jgi:heat-inducible transcriptional repressor